MWTPTGCRWLPWDPGGGRRREGSISCWEGIRDETPLDDSLICHSGWFDHKDCVYPSPKPCWALSFHQMRWICKDLVFSSTCATHQLGSLQHIEGCQKSLLISMQKIEIVVLGINFAHKVLRPWLRGIYLAWRGRVMFSLWLRLSDLIISLIISLISSRLFAYNPSCWLLLMVLL